MGGHAVDSCAHCVFSHPEVQVAGTPTVGGHMASVVKVRLGRWADIGGASHEFGHHGRKGVEHQPGRNPGRHRCPDFECRYLGVPAEREVSASDSVELGGLVGERCSILIEAGGPLIVRGGSLPHQPLPVVIHMCRNFEGLVGPTEMLPGGRRIGSAERCTVCLGGVLHRRPEPDVGPHDHQARSIVSEALHHGGIDRGEIVDITDTGHMPPVRLKAPPDILTEM